MRVLDNSEYGLYLLRERYASLPVGQRPRLLHGDICDAARVKRAIEGVDTVIHAAALKHVWLGEMNPMQTFRVNVEGTQNVVDAALDDGGVKTLVFVSSDKAVNPSNIYGTSKLMGEALILNAEHVKGDRPTAFSVYRCGNFYGSSGSVIEKWSRQAEAEEPLTLVRGDFKRYFVGIYEAAQLLIRSVGLAEGGDVFVPKMREYGMEEIARLLSGDIKWIEPGRGEKRREELWSELEAERLEDLGSLWRIRP